jgi:4-hydroxythreonine-4-phosphate dehydrogenase
MIGITMGDACGVGPEILLRTWCEGKLNTPFVAFGDKAALELAMEKLGLRAELHLVATPAAAVPGKFNLVDLALLRREQITVGKISAPCGAAAVAYIEAATRASLAGEIPGFVTLPVNKEACRLSRPDFEGHTELIAGMCGIVDYTMMLASPKMIVTHVSTHVSLREAVERVQTERILTVARLTQPAALALRGRARLAIAGLNPHAGEHGAFGREDIEQIEPAVAAARAEGIDAHGPLPADTLFMQVINGRYDAVVCMYHDQGHVPMKLHGFADAVNVTLGLPIVRTSVDHGTAFDIAYQGKAALENFIVAIDMCVRLCAGRQPVAANS